MCCALMWGENLRKKHLCGDIYIYKYTSNPSRAQQGPSASSCCSRRCLPRRGHIHPGCSSSSLHGRLCYLCLQHRGLGAPAAKANRWISRERQCRAALTAIHPCNRCWMFCRSFPGVKKNGGRDLHDIWLFFLLCDQSPSPPSVIPELLLG